MGTFDLYNGILGIVLSYATAAVLTDNTHYRNLVLHFTEKLEPILNTLNVRSSVGAYSGLGAFLIFITRLNQLGLINTSQARQVTEKITTHFDKIFKEDYPIFDVIDGTAGYLLALIVSRSLINQDSLDSQLKRCVKHIMTFYPNPHVMPENDGNRRKQAGIDTLIAQLPEELNTSVGERGLRLSGGEKQRLGIARALLKDAPILVLDEATSSLDVHHEKQIIDSLNLMRNKKTIIVISHRLFSIKNVDHIIVLNSEGICEQGCHQLLLDLRGHYYQMWQTQLKQDSEISTINKRSVVYA